MISQMLSKQLPQLLLLLTKITTGIQWSGTEQLKI
jgi:hypothetical protein